MSDDGNECPEDGLDCYECPSYCLEKYEKRPEKFAESDDYLFWSGAAVGFLISCAMWIFILGVLTKIF